MSLEKVITITEKQFASKEKLIIDMIKLGFTLNAKGYAFQNIKGPFFNTEGTERIYILILQKTGETNATKHT